MAIAYWVLLTVLGAAAGWFFVYSLTDAPLDLARAVALALGAAFLSVGLLVWQFSGEYLLAGTVVLFVAIVLGYWAGAKRVLGRDDDRYIPPLTRAPGDNGDGHTAIVYFTHGEPETYDPIGWLNQFREFDDQGIAFVPFLARPFFLRALRHAYLTVGSSQHRSRHLGMASRLEQLLRAEHAQDLRVYPSFLDDNPRPDAAVIDALNDGASQIIVAEVFVSISNHTKEGEDLVRAVDADPFDVPVRFTGPLWDSETLHQMFLDKVEQARGQVPRDRVGVLLVGHGQPDEWDVEWPTETEHEIALRRSILELLVDSGYDRDKVDLAWMEFKQPRVAPRATELARSDIDLLVYFSAGISAESIHSQYDVPKLMSKAQIPAGVAVVNLGAWNDHPLTIQAIAEKVDRLMRSPHQETGILAAES
jgi:protoheme ferro-lyase